MTLPNLSAVPNFPTRALVLLALFCIELLALAILYQFFATIECHQTDLYGPCRFLRSLVARALVVFAVFALLAWARPQPFAGFLAATARSGRQLWALFHGIGVALLLLPLALAPDGNIGAIFGLAIWLFTLGSVLAAVGALLWLAPAASWRALLSQDRYAPLLILALAALLPDVADLALPLWDWQALTGLTFDSVHLFLSLFSSDVIVDAPNYIIGLKQFSVHIARQCSGVEGVALVTAFTGIYAFIFRDTVRFPQYWIIVLPTAILLSWLFNVVRVGSLILIGAHVSPDLAVNGFHSYAGWLFFTALALGVIGAVQATPWLHHTPQAKDEMPLREDPMAAQLLPFVGFMLASLVTHAAFTHPEIGYPIRAAVLLALLWAFRRVYLRLRWGLDPMALAVGAAIGAGWLLLDTPDPSAGQKLAEALAGLSGPMLAAWLVSRLIGTVVLVPIVEEMFFRGYLLTRFDTGKPWGRALAVILSSAAFGALHGRWLAAGVAGVLLACVALRRGRVTDAIVAHITANLIVAIWAFATSDFNRL